MAKTDKQYREEGKEVQFGISQLNNPTPNWMRYIVRGLAIAGAVWAFLDLQYPWAPEVTLWLAKATGVMVIVNRFTGWSAS